MYDFIIAFCGTQLQNYPFLTAIVSCILSSTVLFMFYTIVARVFRVIK